MSKNQQFQKFITYKSNAAKKEEFKREKKAFKKERAAAIEKRFEEKRKLKQEVRSPKEGVGSPESGMKSRKPGTKPQTSGLPLSTQHSPLTAPDLMPLNKYVAHSGVCSRRDAAALIKKGEVKVNDTIVTEPGTKVSSKDTITIKGKKLSPSRNLVYILLNKPKDYITTLDDPEGRKTVLDLIKRATDERVYPVGRLDRNTSGVLLITNDGDLAQTLSHPKNLIKKIYEVRLDKPVTKADFEKIIQGVTLEDGFIAPDSLGYAEPKDKSIIGIEIHSGRNRIVRRIFEHLGYDVRQLDRVMYAGLTKKNVQRGKWRFLTEKEVRILRHFNPQTKKDREKPVKPLPKQRIEKN
jgi:23S rRNA pseudouridine2605 synthase